MDKYDVVIAGAGPAGAQCARTLAAHGRHTVLILDKTQEIGEPKKSTAGTFNNTLRRFALPKKVVMCAITTAVIEGPTETTAKHVEGAVLEFGLLKKFLVEQAVHHGAEVRIGANVTRPILEHGQVAGVAYHDADGDHTVKARIVVDATGPTAVLATQLGLRELAQENHWVGMEFEMEKLKLLHQNAMLMRLDTRYAPGGYSWVFSTGKNHAKVGNCWGLSFFKKQGGNGSQLSYLEKWMKNDERLRAGIPMEMHAGDAYLDAVRKRSADNFLAVGDSVCSINPLFGEGIRPGLCSGELAAQAAIEALRKKDTSAKFLGTYDRQWQKDIGTHRAAARFLSNRLYRMSNKQYDRIARNVRKLDDATVQRFAESTFTLKDVARVLLQATITAR